MSAPSGRPVYEAYVPGQPVYARPRCPAALPNPGLKP